MILYFIFSHVFWEWIFAVWRTKTNISLFFCAFTIGWNFKNRLLPSTSGQPLRDLLIFRVYLPHTWTTWQIDDFSGSIVTDILIWHISDILGSILPHERQGILMIFYGLFCQNMAYCLYFRVYFGSHTDDIANWWYLSMYLVIFQICVRWRLPSSTWARRLGRLLPAGVLLDHALLLSARKLVRLA